MDRRQRIVYWNVRAEALLGWTAREALGKKCWEVFSGRDVFGNVCCFRDCGVAVAASRGESPAPFVMNVRSRDGKERRLITRTVALPSPGATYRTLIHLFDDAESRTLDSALDRVKSVVVPKAERPAPSDDERRTTVVLTPRELQIVRLLAAGYGSVNIAARLDLSHATVRNHIQHLLRRLEVHSQVEAVSVAFRTGLIGRDEEDGGDGRIRTDE